MSKIGNVHVPLLVLHGDRDETIPIEVGWALFDAANDLLNEAKRRQSDDAGTARIVEDLRRQMATLQKRKLYEAESER